MLEQLGLQGLVGLGAIGGSQGQMNNGMLTQQYGSQYNNALSQQQYQWAQHQMNITPPTWVFNGQVYKTAREMADAIWHNDCPDKTHFLLKYE